MNAGEGLFEDRTPGVEEREPSASYLSYTVGLGLAVLATVASFVEAQTNLLWSPGTGSGSDSTNNILALAFGVLIV